MADNNGKTLEEKREMLKALLRQKAGKTGEVKNPTDIKTKNEYSVYTKYANFPEVAALENQFETLQKLNVENPYFRINETIVNDTTQIGGKSLISFSSYNYLGLSGDKRISGAAKKAIEKYGTSVSASRIATGEKPLHGQLENALATLMHTEDAVVFVSGHATNVTVIGHLIRPGKDLIIYDSLGHNSIIEGAMLSGARRLAFPHDDWKALDKILQDNRSDYERVLICAEGVYGMDGNIANVPKLIEVKNKHNALLLVDEAHSMGVIGKKGLGIRDYFNLNAADVDIWMGTFSKSFASCGGYIAGNKDLIKYLRYTTPGFVYSVGISPANAAAALEATKIMQEEPEHAQKLQLNAAFFLEKAQNAKLNTGNSKESAVIPIITGNSAHALMLADALFRDGINVQPILYPAVPDEEARLRFFITCDHSEAQMVQAVDKCRLHLNKIQKEFADVTFPKSAME